MLVKTLRKPKEIGSETKYGGQCVHHWVIDPPDGPISKGTCIRCGTGKDFYNSMFYSSWDGESSLFPKFDTNSDDEFESEDNKNFKSPVNKKKGKQSDGRI